MLLKVSWICTTHSLFRKYLCPELPKKLKYTVLQVPSNGLWQPAGIYHHNCLKICVKSLFMKLKSLEVTLFMP